MAEDKQFEMEKAKHEERIAFAEMEVSKAAYDVSKKKYNKAKFVLDYLSSEYKPSTDSKAPRSTSALQHVPPSPPKMPITAEKWYSENQHVGDRS